MRGELDAVLGLIQENEGIHQSRLLLLITKKLDCGKKKAGFRLERLVQNEEAHFKGFRVYTGGRR